MITNEQIKEKVSELIKSCSMSNIELSKALNVSESCISNYLHKKNLPTLQILANLCKILKVDTNYIFCLTSDDEIVQN